MRADVPRVLSIAGSDPSGGAGVQADLKTFHAFGVYGMAVLTSLTVQNTRGVRTVREVPPGFVAEQLRAIFDDIAVDAVKIGMLGAPEVIEEIAGVLEGARVEAVVVDPVLTATSGHPLTEADAVDPLRRRLLPLASLITPNRAEAGVLAGQEVGDLPDAARAAQGILDAGAHAVLVTGIPDAGEIVDLLLSPSGTREFRLPALHAGATHGTGCTLSSAVASLLARGESLPEAVRGAKDYVWRALESAFPVGGGGLPLNHLVPVEEVGP